MTADTGHIAVHGRRRKAFSELRFLVRGRAGVWLAVLLLIALVRGVLYTFVIPPWQHPDEPAHFEHVRYIAEKGRLPAPDAVDLPIRREIVTSMRAYEGWYYGAPSLDDPAMTQPYYSPVGFSTFVQPRLYYLAAAAWLWPWLGASIETQLLVTRLLSVLLNLGLIAAGVLTVRVAFPENHTLAAAAGVLLVFLPGLTDLMAAVNNDALLNLEGALLFLLLAWIFRHGPRLMPVALSLALAAAGYFTKRTGVLLIGLLPLAAVIYLLRSGRRWALAGVLIILLLACLAGAGLYFASAGESVQSAIGAWFYRYFRADLARTLDNLTSPGRVSLYVATTRIVFRSFWAAFGWREVLLARPWYSIPLAEIVLAAAGLGLGWIWARGGARHKPRAWRTYLLFFAALAVSSAWLAAIVRSQAYQGGTPYLSHGRYAYVAIVPFALLMVRGLEVWVPRRLRPAALWAFVALNAGFEAVAFWGYLIPFYHVLA